MDEVSESTRRQNYRTAQIVQWAISLQFTAGAEEAKRYLAECGISIHVIERVLSSTGAPRRPPCGAIYPQDRRHK